MKILNVILSIIIASTFSFSQNDQLKIEAACLNYIEGFYEGDTSKLLASLSPDLYKFGYWKNDKGEYIDQGQMTHKEAIEFALNVKKNGDKRSEGAIKEVVVLDIANHIASAKVRAWWGVDYIHLAKKGDEWIIEQVIWEGPPETIETAPEVSIDSFYHTIPDIPEIYTPYTVAARVVDGLGFRYYWATEGLREEDLAFKPGDESRTSRETLDHIYGLSSVVLNAIKSEANISTNRSPIPEDFISKRRETLRMIQEASELLKSNGHGQMSNYDMVFQRGETKSSYPFWNVLNGPLADAIWHVGQVVSYRRLSGNPFDSKVSVLRGARRK